MREKLISRHPSNYVTKFQNL